MKRLDCSTDCFVLNRSGEAVVSKSVRSSTIRLVYNSLALPRFVASVSHKQQEMHSRYKRQRIPIVHELAKRIVAICCERRA